MTAAPSIDVNALMRGLVHELRNPLSAILTASTLLNGSPELDEETAMLLEVVEKEAKRMNRIMTEFASFVKPPAAHPETFDLAKTLRDVIREMQREGGLHHAIEVRDELPEHLLVLGDPVHIFQALHHIFANAAEAMPSGGHLHLHAEQGEKTARIFLDDSGVGFPAEALERAVHPFYSTKAAATGLGLSIAEGLLRASGGALSLGNRVLEENHAPIVQLVAPIGLFPAQAVAGARVRVELPLSSE